MNFHLPYYLLAEEVPEPKSYVKTTALEKTVSPLLSSQKELDDKLTSLQTSLTQIHRDLASLSQHRRQPTVSINRDLLIVGLLFVLQAVLFWLFRNHTAM